MTQYYDHTPPPPIERLARIEGQSNFLSLLAGVEAGPDTTEDMAALSFARARGAIPEVLEAYAGQSDLFKLPLMTLVFRALRAEMKAKEADWPWMQGAVADAFLLVQKGICKPSAVRSRRFKVREETYRTMRTLARGIFAQLIADAEQKWKRARFGRA